MIKKAKRKTKKNGTAQNSSMDWLPVKEVKNGIIALKNGGYVKLLEILPINFLLRSKQEQRNIIYSFREFLKACLFPMQICIQSVKADTSRHTGRMKEFLEVEKNENARDLISAYIDLVEELQSTEGVKRRFFVSFSFVPVPGVSSHPFEDVLKQLTEKAAKVKNFIKLCGNQAEETEKEDRYLLELLYSSLNRKAYAIRRLTGKLDSHLFPTLIGKTEVD